MAKKKPRTHSTHVFNVIVMIEEIKGPDWGPESLDCDDYQLVNVETFFNETFLSKEEAHKCMERLLSTVEESPAS
jgi:hypothetical protein